MRAFIDVGAFNGDTALKAMGVLGQGWEYFLFEAVPENCDLINRRIVGYDMHVINAIVGNSTGSRCSPIFVSDQPGCSSVFPDKLTGGVSSERYQWVDAVRLSDFMSTHLTETDDIIVKLNVEGSEYKIIDDLCERNVIHWIDRLYIAWHDEDKIPSLKGQKEMEIGRLKWRRVEWIEWTFDTEIKAWEPEQSSP
jgi:FkbM family methyltransferase